MSEHEEPNGSGESAVASGDARSISARLSGLDMWRRVPLPDRLGWLLVAILIVIQWGLFRQFAIREVTWSYPPNHDQLNFLDASYTGYELILRSPWRGIKQAGGFIKPPRPKLEPGPGTLPPRGLPPRTKQDQALGPNANEMMLTLQAALLFCFAGPGRLVALSLNFVYFALLQCALVGTVRWLSGRWSIALIALGLLLMAGTPFFWAGGLSDFRLDFVAFCLYGTFVCLVIRSGSFADRNWSIAAGACGALLFTFRFVTLVYLIGVFGLVILSLLIRMRAGRGRNQLARTQLRNALLGCSLIAIVALPVVIGRWGALKQYYVAGHVTGAEKGIRAAEQGVIDVWTNLRFYPRSLWNDHAGREMVRWCGWLLLAGAIAMFLRIALAKDRQWTGAMSDASSGMSPLLLVFVISAILVPLGVLTLDKAKSPVVADVMLIPTVWIVLFAFMWLCGTRRGLRPLPLIRWGLPVLSALVLCRGVIAQVDHSTQRTTMNRHRDSIEKLEQIYDRIAGMSSSMGWKSPALGFDSTSDALNYKGFKVMAYERHGELFEPAEVLSNTIFTRDNQREIERLRYADFVLLSDNVPAPPGGFELPFDQMMRELRPTLRDWCRRNMVEIETEHLGAPFDRDVTVFARPAVQIKCELDGWIAKRGTRLVALAEVLRARPDITLSGPNSAPHLPAPPHVTEWLSDEMLPERTSSARATRKSRCGTTYVCR